MIAHLRLPWGEERAAATGFFASVAGLTECIFEYRSEHACVRLVYNAIVSWSLTQSLFLPGYLVKIKIDALFLMFVLLMDFSATKRVPIRSLKQN